MATNPTERALAWFNPRGDREMVQHISDNQREMFHRANSAIALTIQAQRDVFGKSWERARVAVQAARSNLEELAERIEKERAK
jgi:CO/xanthine dehydrogenase FAD-binding subunit